MVEFRLPYSQVLNLLLQVVIILFQMVIFLFHFVKVMFRFCVFSSQGNDNLLIRLLIFFELDSHFFEFGFEMTAFFFQLKVLGFPHDDLFFKMMFFFLVSLHSGSDLFDSGLVLVSDDDDFFIASTTVIMIGSAMTE